MSNGGGHGGHAPDHLTWMTGMVDPVINDKRTWQTAGERKNVISKSPVARAPVIAARKTYSQIDPALYRELFIRRGGSSEDRICET